jgi:hypothetical protein
MQQIHPDEHGMSQGAALSTSTCDRRSKAACSVWRRLRRMDSSTTSAQTNPLVDVSRLSDGTGGVLRPPAASCCCRFQHAGDGAPKLLWLVLLHFQQLDSSRRQRPERPWPDLTGAADPAMQALLQTVLLRHAVADSCRPPLPSSDSAGTLARWLRLHGIGPCMHVAAGVHPSSGGSFLHPAA